MLRLGEPVLAIRRLQSRRAAGVPTVAVLVGPAGLAVREWLLWADGENRPTARAHVPSLVDVSVAWVAESLGSAEEFATAWLAAILGHSRTETAERLAAMTRYDFDTCWRALPTDTTRPAARTAYVLLADRFRDTPLTATDVVAELSAVPAVCGLSELLPEDRWPTLLVVRDRPSADPNWLAGVIRAVEPLITAVPRLAVGVVASDAEYVAFTERADATRHQTLAREGFVPVAGVSAGELVNRLAAADLTPPPADTLRQLTADGLSEEASAAFVETARAVAVRAEGDVARSAAERFLYEQLNAHLPTAGLFRLNCPLDFRHGSKPAEADLAAERLKVIVEVDGGYFHLNPDQYRRDRRKDWLYQTHGYFVLRFLAEDVVTDLSTILTTVTEAVALRRRPPSDPRGVDRL